MSDTETNVKFGADISQLKDGMAQASSAVSQSVNTMKESISGLSAVIQTFTGFLAGALSVGAMKGAIDAATSYNASIISLSRVMGETTEQASYLATAIKIIGGSTEEYAAMNMRLGMHIKSNADALEQLGVKLKDSNGNLLSQQEIFNNTIKAMSEYKEGADRNQFALYAFGRGAAEVYKYLNLNKDVMAAATEIADKYGLVVGGEAAEKTKQMSYEVNKMGLIFDAVKIAIGNELLPVLVNFAGELGGLAKGILPVVSTGLKILANVWEVMKFKVQEATTVIVASVFAISDAVGAVAKSAMALARGDFQGAWNAMKDGYDAVRMRISTAGDQMEANERKHAARIKDIWGGLKAPDAAGPGKGTKSFVAPDTKKGKEDKSRMPEWEEQYREAYLRDEQAHGGYLERKLFDELAYWQKIEALPNKSATETLAVARKITDLKIAMYKEEYDEAQRAAAELRKIEELKADAVKQGAAAAIAAKKEEFNTAVALGKISKEEEMASLKSFLDQEYALELSAAQKKLELMEKGTVEYQKQLNAMAALQAKYALDVQKVEGKGAIATQEEWKKAIQPITQAFDTSVMGIIQGTQTLKAGLANLFQSITLSFINDTIKTMLSNWLLGENQKLAISTLTSRALVALGIETAAQKATATTTGAETEITANAATAASGAASAEASIPVVGPGLAAGAAAAMMAMVMGFKSLLSFDVGGWVPSSGLAMLHENELVLKPNEAAAVMGGGKAGSGTQIHVHNLQAWDSRDVKSFLSGNHQNLATALKRAQRMNSAYGR